MPTLDTQDGSTDRPPEGGARHATAPAATRGADAGAYPRLLAPLTLAGRTLRNRLVHPSMSTFLPAAGRVTPRMIRYFANRADGGAGMIVCEPFSMAPHQDVPNRVVAWSDADLDGLKRLAESVESRDCRLVGQLLERGRGRNVPGRSPDAIGASALPDDLSWTMPRALATAEIDALIDTFVESVGRLRRCGFSGIEVSAAHGHFFHQFLSPWSNRRDDAYGGDLDRRTRLVARLVAGVREHCGTGFIVGLKLPGDDGVAGSVDPAEAGRIARHLVACARPDYICFAQGSHARSLEMHVPDGYSPRNPYQDLLARLRPSVDGVPLIALGRITDPAEAEAILARGTAEMVAVGRGLIADPAWLSKATAGRAHDIRYCVSCNTCWHRISAQRMPLACDNNPRVAEVDEVDHRPRPAPATRRIVVVGAGIAGLEAAWVAAARGHAVTLFGRSAAAGGSARLRAMLPGGESFSSIHDYQQAAATRAGARLELGVDATLDDVLACDPHEVVIATGATMIEPHWLPSHATQAGWVRDLRQSIVEVLRHPARIDGSAVLYDMDHTEGTYACADLLHERFARVVIVTPREGVAADTPLVVRQGIHRRLREKRIRVAAYAEPVWNEAFERDARLRIDDVFNHDTETIDDVAFLSYSTPRRPSRHLADALRDRGLPVRLVGDCVSPRDALAATGEGHAAGHAV
ncbi:MAG: NAD(P)-binding protein [Lautropia sp.]